MGTFGSISGPGERHRHRPSAATTSGTPSYQAKSAATYDTYGRTLASTDANGNVTTTAYTPATGALPTRRWSPTRWAGPPPPCWTRPGSCRSRSPTRTGRSPPRPTTRLGRLTAVWLPTGRFWGQAASNTYAYSITGTSPPSVTTSTLREDGSYSTAVKIYDGMLQLRQEQTTTADNESGG